MLSFVLFPISDAIEKLKKTHSNNAIVGEKKKKKRGGRKVSMMKIQSDFTDVGIMLPLLQIVNKLPEEFYMRTHF